MKIGIIGYGVVGKALSDWYLTQTTHTIAIHDPYKSKKDDLSFSDAIFICINIKQKENLDSDYNLSSCVDFAKSYSKNVFIKSTVLPGTNDFYKTISCPEFLTERIAAQEMQRLQILIGDINLDFSQKLFPGKAILKLTNTECELAKLLHNCFGAVKVTYFNAVYHIAQQLNCNYERVLEGMLLSGFINKPHTQVPGHDSMFGYGGSCFPSNMDMIINHLKKHSNDDNIKTFKSLFDIVSLQNIINRKN